MWSFVSTSFAVVTSLTYSVQRVVVVGLGFVEVGSDFAAGTGFVVVDFVAGIVMKIDH